ncbi:MAG: histidine--tRNA ligase [Candidatus Puniceispirillaceae bacterium]
MDIIQPVRGTSDLLPADKAKHNHVIDCAKQGAAQFGYAEMATPMFEFTEVFSRPLGASSDVVAKETYSFEDRGGTGLTLRPEGTAAAMRAIISNGLTQSLPQRWFYAGPMFRYERPQKGRMRQFHQIGCELIGPASPLGDAEIIACGVHILKSLGVLDQTVLHLNTLGDSDSRQAYRAALIAYLQAYRNDLSEDSQRRLDTNPLRILDSKSASDRDILQDAPQLHRYLTPAAQTHFDAVKEALQAASIAWVDDPFLVRGLDYYSHTAFEFITDQLGAQGTVLGGGRYDGLSQSLGGPLLPAVGFAAGIERLALLGEEQAQPVPDLVLLAAEQSAEADLFALGCRLRADGYHVVSILSGNMGKKMKAANRLGARFALIAGADELGRNCVSLRNMQDGTQTEVDISVIGNWLAQQG